MITATTEVLRCRRISAIAGAFSEKLEIRDESEDTIYIHGPFGSGFYVSRDKIPEVIANLQDFIKP